MKSSAITIREISYMSGFSVSTVSKALNDKQDISKETRKAIKHIAKKLNYIPNNFAVSLRGKRSKSIAVVIPSVIIPHYSKALFYLQKVAEDSGYRVLLYQTFNSVKKEDSYIQSINDGSIDGAFIISDTPVKRSENISKDFPLINLKIEKTYSEKKIEKLTKNCLARFISHKSDINSMC